MKKQEIDCITIASTTKFGFWSYRVGCKFHGIHSFSGSPNYKKTITDIIPVYSIREMGNMVEEYVMYYNIYVEDNPYPAASITGDTQGLIIEFKDSCHE